MKSNDIIAEALRRGLYRVDPEEGIVYGQRGQALACPPDRDGYLQVVLSIDGSHATVRAHRVVAAAAWGIAAICGRQVGHRDGNPANNRISNLWLPKSQREHYWYDNKVRPKPRKGAPIKTHWLPCIRCGNPDGPPFYGRRTPARVTGAKFGVDGDLCWRCYRALDERVRRQRLKAANS